MNMLQEKTTIELLKEAKSIYLDPTLTMTQIEERCKALIEEINKRFESTADKFNQLRRTPTIKRVQDLKRFRV